LLLLLVIGMCLLGYLLSSSLALSAHATLPPLELGDDELLECAPECDLVARIGPPEVLYPVNRPLQSHYNSC